MGCMLFGACSPAARPADASVRGIALGLFASEPGYDYGVLLREIAEQGATDLLLVVPWQQTDLGSDDLSAPPVRLAQSLRQARALGLRCAVMPIVRLQRIEDGAPHQWRGQLRPREGTARWFHRYRQLLIELAHTAQEGGAARLGIGSELVTLEPYTAEWQETVRAVRRVFVGPQAGAGRLFYSLNWDSVSALLPLPGFLPELDEVGIAAYFPLTESDQRPDPAALSVAWIAPRARLRELRARLGSQPLFFTEIGYPSLPTAAQRPWDQALPTIEPEDQTLADSLLLQHDLYEAFCQSFSGQGELSGFYAWNWFGFGGPTDRTFTPRGKPAATALRRCLHLWR